eukprot:gene5348-7419_t
MVLHGQDAWRKNPMFYGHWKKPFPRLKLACGIFSVYVALDIMQRKVLAPPPSPYHGPYEEDDEDM